MAKLGLFCGTFNPIHLGHLLIGECAYDQFNLDKVIFVTSPSPPHRQSEELLDARARHAMVLDAVSDNTNFAASDWELERDGPSYTVDTVQHFASQDGGNKIFLIVGGDNIKYLPTWHASATLFKHCKILAAPRLLAADMQDTVDQRYSDKASMLSQELPPQSAHLDEADVEVIDFPGMAISSSSIRKRLRAGHSVLYMVPRSVRDTLVKEKYYLP